MGLEPEFAVLACVKAGKRPPFAWERTCRIYKDLRKAGLIEKSGRRHVLTGKGRLVLSALE